MSGTDIAYATTPPNAATRTLRYAATRSYAMCVTDIGYAATKGYAKVALLLLLLSHSEQTTAGGCEIKCKYGSTGTKCIAKGVEPAPVLLFFVLRFTLYRNALAYALPTRCPVLIYRMPLPEWGPALRMLPSLQDFEAVQPPPPLKFSALVEIKDRPPPSHVAGCTRNAIAHTRKMSVQVQKCLVHKRPDVWY
eukprot:1587714-Rhodomonas_salina.1